MPMNLIPYPESQRCIELVRGSQCFRDAVPGSRPPLCAVHLALQQAEARLAATEAEISKAPRKSNGKARHFCAAWSLKANRPCAARAAPGSLYCVAHRNWTPELMSKAKALGYGGASYVRSVQMRRMALAWARIQREAAAQARATIVLRDLLAPAGLSFAEVAGMFARTSAARAWWATVQADPMSAWLCRFEPERPDRQPEGFNVWRPWKSGGLDRWTDERLYAWLSTESLRRKRPPKPEQSFEIFIRIISLAGENVLAWSVRWHALRVHCLAVGPALHPSLSAIARVVAYAATELDLGEALRVAALADPPDPDPGDLLAALGIIKPRLKAEQTPAYRELRAALIAEGKRKEKESRANESEVAGAVAQEIANAK